VYIHAKQRELEDRLKSVFDELDVLLEDEYGDEYPLHPNRPARGDACNHEADGLFEAAADFTPGFGSELGRGYLVSIRVATLSRVNPETREHIMASAIAHLRRLLPQRFPERALSVRREGDHFKIVGDFSLGTV